MTLDPGSDAAADGTNTNAAGAHQPDAFTVRDAGVRLGDRWIWRHVDLDVAAGEFVAILGPNGSGKSTLIKALLGLLPLAEGSIHVLGVAAARRSRRVGYLPQRRTFDTDVRVRGRDIVRLGVDGARWGFSLPGSRRSREAQRRVDNVAELVGAAGFIDAPIGELSGGEQQRLLIAQALVAHPDVLLLDEPFDSLDISNQQAISGLVETICAERGVTVVLVAHDVNPILTYLDRVIYVAGGGAVSGRPDEVITTATLTRLYGSTVEVLTTLDGRLVVAGAPKATSFHGHD